MDPAKPPDPWRRPMSYAEASKGMKPRSGEAPDLSKRQPMSYAEAGKGKQNMTSPKPPAPSWPRLPCGNASSKGAPSIEPAYPPAQSKLPMSHASIHKETHLLAAPTSPVSSRSSKVDAHDAAKEKHQLASPKPPARSRPAISYADVARKNAPAKKQATQQVVQQAKEHKETRPPSATATSLATQTSPGTNEPLLAIENVVKSVEAIWDSAGPKPSEVPERERRPWERFLDPTPGTTEQTAKTAKSPLKTRPVTWAGVVKGQKPGVMPATPATNPPTPHIQPATSQPRPTSPRLNPAPPHVDYHVSPSKHPRSNKKHNSPAQQKSKENSNPKTHSPQQAENGLGASLPTEPDPSKSKIQAPDQPEKPKTELDHIPAKGTPSAHMSMVAGPTVMQDLPSFPVEANSKLAPCTDRAVPIYPSGNLAATLKKRQEGELAKKTETAFPPRQPPTTTYRPSLGNPASSATKRPNGQSARKRDMWLLVSPSPHLPWPAHPPSFEDIRRAGTHRFEDFPRVSAQRFENNPGRGYGPTERHFGGHIPRASAQDEALKREREKSAMRRGIFKETANLWQYQFGWDVLVTCGPKQWRLHRHILEAESAWFAKRLGPPDPRRSYAEFSCAGHDFNALGHALWFMYHGAYPGSTPPPDDPLDGDCIRRNIYMYICGASVDCRAMTAFAVAATERTAEVLGRTMPAAAAVDGDAPLHRLYMPLRDGLELLLAQGNRPDMLAARVAVARLVDVTLLYLLRNRGFQLAFQASWVQDVYPMCFWDSVLFRRMGLIGRPDEDVVVAVGEGHDEEEGTVVGGDSDAGEKLPRDDEEENDDDGDVTPRPEKKREDAEIRGDLPREDSEQQHGTEQQISERVDTPPEPRQQG